MTVTSKYTNGGLTEGMSYSVLDSTDNKYLIENDRGERLWYSQSLFY